MVSLKTPRRRTEAGSRKTPAFIAITSASDNKRRPGVPLLRFCPTPDSTPQCARRFVRSNSRHDRPFAALQRYRPVTVLLSPPDELASMPARDLAGSPSIGRALGGLAKRRR